MTVDASRKKPSSGSQPERLESEDKELETTQASMEVSVQTPNQLAKNGYCVFEKSVRIQAKTSSEEEKQNAKAIRDGANLLAEVKALPESLKICGNDNPQTKKTDSNFSQENFVNQNKVFYENEDSLKLAAEEISAKLKSSQTVHNKLLKKFEMLESEIKTLEIDLAKITQTLKGLKNCDSSESAEILNIKRVKLEDYGICKTSISEKIPENIAIPAKTALITKCEPTSNEVTTVEAETWTKSEISKTLKGISKALQALCYSKDQEPKTSTVENESTSLVDLKQLVQIPKRRNTKIKYKKNFIKPPTMKGEKGNKIPVTEEAAKVWWDDALSPKVMPEKAIPKYQLIKIDIKKSCKDKRLFEKALSLKLGIPQRQFGAVLYSEEMNCWSVMINEKFIKSPNLEDSILKQDVVQKFQLAQIKKSKGFFLKQAKMVLANKLEQNVGCKKACEDLRTAILKNDDNGIRRVSHIYQGVKEIEKDGSKSPSYYTSDFEVWVDTNQPGPQL